MEKETKKQFKEALRTYCDKMGSQNKAANSLNISSATLSHILNGKWDNISDEMIRSIAARIGFKGIQGWQTVNTGVYKVLNTILTDAKEHSNVYGVVGKAGTGKTNTMKFFTDTPNAFRVQCSEYMNRKTFLVELMRAMGLDSSSLTIAEMMTEIIYQLKRKDRPVLLLDEADKLVDQVLYFFITLYNEMEDSCGMVLCATSHLEKRIKKGAALNKKGYNEIYSRLGRKFITLPDVSFSDVASICVANGISQTMKVTVELPGGKKRQEDAIQHIYDDSEGDLRRVKRKIHALKNLTTNEETND